VFLSSLTSLTSQSAPASPSEGVRKVAKKANEGATLKSDKPAQTADSPNALTDPPKRTEERFPWKTQIVTTVFWIGERPSKNNPVPNHKSCWDANWARNYGGEDMPDPARRKDFSPVDFVPGLNPFYIALPYNDKMREGYKPEAPLVVPWFNEAVDGSGASTCKGRWVAIRFGNRVCYAQWEDAGPFRTDHWQYVFGNERPKPNLNQGAGLDVSPAVRDFLGIQATDVTDWKFVDFKDVPPGPWSKLGENNTFVLQAREKEQRLAKVRSQSYFNVD
jgi:hypothetical protein